MQGRSLAMLLLRAKDEGVKPPSPPEWTMPSFPSLNHHHSLGIMLHRLMQCTLAAPCSLPGASSNHSRPGSGLASHFTPCLFDLVPSFPRCLWGQAFLEMWMQGEGPHPQQQAQWQLHSCVAGLQPLEHQMGIGTQAQAACGASALGLLLVPQLAVTPVSCLSCKLRHPAALPEVSS